LCVLVFIIRPIAVLGMDNFGLFRSGKDQGKIRENQGILDANICGHPAIHIRSTFSVSGRMLFIVGSNPPNRYFFSVDIVK